MSKVVFDISTSLDGFIAAAGRSPEHPTGPGGDRLTEWAFGRDKVNQRYLEEAVGGLGAVICGRATYDSSLPWWQSDGPSGPARRPVFVVTHAAPESAPADGVYHFATQGLEDALSQARVAAGDKTVCIMGGADIGRQYIDAGLVDEISLHVVPVLFGEGTRLFEKLSDHHMHLETLEVISTPDAIHTRFGVLGRS